MITEQKKISDITVAELRDLIREAIYEIIDPDYGLVLRPEVEKELLQSLRTKERISVEEVARKVGLDW